MFQQLTVNWDFDPVMFSIGSFDIRYYGLMWAIALLLGGVLFNIFCKREGLPRSVADSIFLFGTIATVVGARVGHCLFYEPENYLSQPWTIVTDIRNGGMASHGAAVGLLIGLWLFSRRNKLPYIWSLDRIMIPVAIGGAIVRIGNLFNSEIVGGECSLPWGFKFVRNWAGTPIDQIPAQHPTQIYEALCYLATFAVLAYVYFRKDWGRKRPGILFGLGLIGIFLTRFFIEFVKERQVGFESDMPLDMGQLLSLPFIFLGGWMLRRALLRPEVRVDTTTSEPHEGQEHKHPKKRKGAKW